MSGRRHRGRGRCSTARARARGGGRGRPVEHDHDPRGRPRRGREAAYDGQVRVMLVELGFASLLAACSTSGAGGGSDASTLADGGCWTSADCRGGGTCASPGEVLLGPCGGPPPHVECRTPADCDAGADGGGDIRCQPADCEGAVCQGPCRGDEDCPRAALAPSVCDVASGMCVRAKCAPQSCGDDFVCNRAVGCVPKRCKADVECAGRCVNGACVSGPGHCAFPPPPPP